jgi:hypothetical protein
MTVVCAGGQVNGIDLEPMIVSLVAALWCCTGLTLAGRVRGRPRLNMRRDDHENDHHERSSREYQG